MRRAGLQDHRAASAHKALIAAIANVILIFLHVVSIISTSIATVMLSMLLVLPHVFLIRAYHAS